MTGGLAPRALTKHPFRGGKVGGIGREGTGNGGCPAAYAITAHSINGPLGAKLLFNRTTSWLSACQQGMLANPIARAWLV
ncbi:hypothetical protein K227x_20440 [Rubripirellula lacrimiformis]|uniref:Uncharacterized protein n=1 Tax=Rubripirellula lacrimiformis TaxID=1930273 RepID=A0A517N944_9BACT|nr:hypothetical protein K227x_20440 [Rubripirellula lacrimiformis]